MTHDVTPNLVRPDTSVRRVIELIDNAALNIALVVDGERRLLGTVTDADIRRCILHGCSLDGAVEGIMHTTPTTAAADLPPAARLALMRRSRHRHLPIIDNERRVVDILVLDDLVEGERHDNWVVLMAGGLGSRLRPLTENLPKPLLQVGNKPLLEQIIENFIEHGFGHFFISVNYLAEKVRTHFGDGSRWGVKIDYLSEEHQLGTAGALGLLPTRPTKPVIVMNGDLLTKLNFNQLLDFHAQNGAAATMCVREYDMQIPYGVVKIDGHRIRAIEEKPVQSFFVNAGIYVLEPEVIERIPRDKPYDMPLIYQQLLDEKRETAVFPIREYWIDIGHIHDYERANAEFATVFRLS